MAGFAAKGGNGLLLKNFEKDPNYLRSIGLVSTDYKLEKVAVNTAYSDFGPSFYGDNKVVFATSSNKSEGYKIYEWNQSPLLIYSLQIWMKKENFPTLNLLVVKLIPHIMSLQPHLRKTERQFILPERIS